jgi:hypothetical protein
VLTEAKIGAQILDRMTELGRRNFERTACNPFRVGRVPANSPSVQQRPFLADLSGKQQAKSVPPKSNRLMAGVDAAFVQKILDVSERKWITHIHSND